MTFPSFCGSYFFGGACLLRALTVRFYVASSIPFKTSPTRPFFDQRCAFRWSEIRLAATSADGHLIMEIDVVGQAAPPCKSATSSRLRLQHNRHYQTPGFY